MYKSTQPIFDGSVGFHVSVCLINGTEGTWMMMTMMMVFILDLTKMFVTIVTGNEATHHWHVHPAGVGTILRTRPPNIL